MNNNYCVLPWIHIAADTDGSVKPCCIFKGHIKKEDGTNYNLGNDKIEDFFNTSDYISIRENMINNVQTPGCEQCYKIENFGKESKRVLMNRRFADMRPTEILTDAEIQFFDLRFGNLCNLKCRSCQPINSSQLDKQVQDHPELQKFYPYFGYAQTEWYETETFKHNIDSNLKHIKLIYLAGGEPTLIDRTYKFLEDCIKLGYNEKISLIVVSNVTYENDTFTDLIKKFKNVIYYASIDGYKEVQEYLRYPSKWDHIDRNISKLVTNNTDNVSIRFTPTIQITNLSNIVDLFEYGEQFNREHKKSIIQFFVNQLESPSYLNLINLPLDYKKQCWDKINEWVQTKCQYQPETFYDTLKAVEGKCLEDVDYKYNLTQFFEFNDLLDKVQNKKLIDINPDLYKLKYK